MRIISYALILGLVFQGFAISPVKAAGDEICATDTYTPDAKTPKEIADKCGGNGEYKSCVNTREALIKWSNDYKEIAEQACQKRRDSIDEINDLNQRSSYGEVASRADAGIKDIETLIQANETILKAIPKATDQNLAALRNLARRPDSPEQFRKSVKKINSGFMRAKQRPEVLKEDIISESDISSLTEKPKVAKESKAEIYTLIQSQKFVRALLLDQEKNEQAKQELQQAKNDALKNQNNTQTAEDPAIEENGSGFNPMSLLPFAAPLAGLLMQKNAQESGLSDSMSSDSGVATPEEISGTSLENKGQTTPSTGLTDTNKPDAEMQMPGETYAGGSEYVDTASGDISQNDADNNGNPLTGVGFSSNSAGASDSIAGDSSKTGAKTDRKPASGASGSEETLIAAGGGGMAYAGAAASEGEAQAEGDMKDILHDMEATLEDAPTGLFAEAERANSGSEIGAQDGDSLFPRVRACYVRNLKKGFVLNGLGEKLPDSDSD